MTAAKASVAISTGELMQRLQRHYIKPGQPLPGGVFLPEVGWNGGGLRRCDAIYVGFTSTSGRLLVGHEVKTSRADWLRELDDVHKADEWADQCHEWWLVVGDPAIVHDGELPAGWGLMVPGRSKTRLDVIHKADRKPATHTPSWRAVRSVIARQDTLRANAVAAIERGAEQRAWARYEQQVSDRVESKAGNTAAKLDQAVKRLDQIERALGCKIDFSDNNWVRDGQITLDDLAKVADLIKGQRQIDKAVADIVGRYGSPLNAVRRGMEQLDDALAKIKAAHDDGIEDQAGE